MLYYGQKGGIAIYTIEALRELLSPIARRHGVKKLSVFGSVARGEATEESDVDLLVEIPRGWGLFALGGLYSDIESVLSCEFDLVTTGIEDKDFLARIRKDEILLYEE